jgi:hypothetical protein
VHPTRDGEHDPDQDERATCDVRVDEGLGPLRAKVETVVAVTAVLGMKVENR